MSEIPSCLPTCSREHGHTKGCPVSGMQYRQMSNAGMQGVAVVGPTDAERGLPEPGRTGFRPSPYSQTAAGERWGRAAVEVRDAQQSVMVAEAALASARGRYAAAQKEAREALAELQAEAKSIMGEE